MASAAVDQSIMSSVSSSAPVSRKRSRSPEAVEKIRRTGVQVDKSIVIDEQFVSGTNVRNYLNNDPILDWLSYHSSAIAKSKPEYTPIVAKAVSIKGSATNFTEFLMSQGLAFERSYVDYLYGKFEKRHIVDIGGGTHARSYEKFQETIDAMQRGIPIIYSGVLHNYEDKTFGVPDLIVRSDWINRLTTTPAISVVDSTIHAPLLTDPSTGREPRYHYRIIDIKYTTLYLCCKGDELLNSGSFPAYKGQLLIYTDALAKVQGYHPKVAYLLGRKWTYTSKGETFRGRSCADRLGVVNYDGRDSGYVERTKEAITWIRDMRTNGAGWDISKVPFPRKELYPNMSNQQDYPWGAVKEAIAKDIKEITDLWMCGPKNRVYAHDNGILSWDDPRCCSRNIGMTGTVTPAVLDAIIKTNRDTSAQVVFPKIIETDLSGWQKPQRLEFYVDFEYMNDINCKFDKMPFADSIAAIFMIGVGYYHPDLKDANGDPEWVYRSFVAKDLSAAGEKEICELFSDYIRQECDFFDCQDPLLVHWANAENWQWSHAVERHRGIEQLWIEVEKPRVTAYGIYRTQAEVDDSGEPVPPKVIPRWFDLLTIFKKEPITIKGCLGFGLKKVAGALASNGLIETTWEKVPGGCIDGPAAMLAAFGAYEEAKRRKIPLFDMPQIKDIRKYNEVDCKVLGEIITFLRRDHTAK